MVSIALGMSRLKERRCDILTYPAEGPIVNQLQRTELDNTPLAATSRWRPLPTEQPGTICPARDRRDLCECRHDDRIVSIAMSTAIEADRDGPAHGVGMDTGSSESKPFRNSLPR